MGDVSCRRLGTGSAVVGCDANVSHARELPTSPFLQLTEFIQLFAFAWRPAECEENGLVQCLFCASSHYRIVTEVLFAISFVIPEHELFFL